MDANNLDMFLGASPSLFEKAKQLRGKETEAEKLLWKRLSNNQLGVRFRRQHPIYNYIADFYCHSHKLIIEVDGGIHQLTENKLYDESRDHEFKTFAIRTIRFSNNEVLNDIEEVVRKIRECLEQPRYPPTFSR